MPGPGDKSYTSNHRIDDDGVAHFACSLDRSLWPWLALPPDHPVPLMTQNYWISVECSALLGGFDRDKWSALVWTDWCCGPPGAGHATQGSFERTETDELRGFTTTLHDAQGRPVARMRGRAVVFRTRNFEQWREGSKRAAREQEDHGEFVYAARGALGLGEDEQPFLGEPGVGGTPALITRDNGFIPGNRYIGGSGDHVNSTHIAEVARQFLMQGLGGAAVRVTGGEMTLNHYIEIGTPFLLECAGQSAGRIDMALGQLGRPCAEVVLHYAIS